MRRLVLGAAIVALAGVLAAPSALAKPQKVDVCHATPVGSTGEVAWHLIRVGAPAVEAHLAHGDGLPGEAVPGMDGWTFDGVCGQVAPVVTVDPEPEPEPQPEPEPLPHGVCLDGTHHLDVLAVPDVAHGSSQFASTDGTCTGDAPSPLTVVSGAADPNAARTACSALLGERYYSVFHLQPWYPDAPADWWMCF